MKISTIYNVIKAFYLAGPLLASPACAPVVAEAPFTARPDSTEPGDLLGPFDGRVLDAATGKPIAGAAVWASWGFEIGRGLTAPAGNVELATESDADGRWRLPRLPHIPRGRQRVARFTLVVYKPGWLAWRSDRRFEDNRERHDFAQSGSTARLERFTGGLSHVRHVRFAGGGGAIRRAMAGELVQAALELSGKGEETAAEAAAGPLLDASGLLSSDELRAATGWAGDFELGRLADLPQTGTYDSRHFKAVGKPESYDAALRVWRPATREAAEAEYERLVKTVPSAEQKNEIADRSLRGHDGKILAVAALDRGKRLVVQLTCGVDQCRDHAQAVALLRRVMARGEKLDKPVEKKPPEDKPKSEEIPEPEGSPFPQKGPR